MTKLFFILITVMSFLPISAQQGLGNEIDVAIALIEKQVDSIDNQIRFKSLVDYGGYRLGGEDEINEWLAVLYFDDNRRVVKSKFIFSYPEDQGFYYRYYDTNGVAIHSLHSTSSGMNNSFSVSRYLNADISLLYIDFLRRDDDRGGIIIEHTCRTGGYGLQLPQEWEIPYDIVMDTKSLEKELIQFFKIDSLYMPQQVDSVKFIKARKGDKSFITHNSVPLFEEKSDNKKQLMELNVGNKIEILEVDEGWYKIRYRTWEKQTIGYVKSDFIAPVELFIKN